MISSHEIGGQASRVLELELELALAAIQKCLNILHDDLVPDTKKLWLINHSNVYGIIR